MGDGPGDDVGRTRAIIAAALATIYPGLGHVYLREWFRAFAWFVLSVATAALVVPPDVVSAYETGGFGALWEASRSLPMEALLAVLAVRVLNVVDAAWLGLQPTQSSGSTDGPSCPNCGRELDADLDFCHWCTAPLDGPPEESAADGGLL